MPFVDFEHQELRRIAREAWPIALRTPRAAVRPAVAVPRRTAYRAGRDFCRRGLSRAPR